jgi:hypothetical protein
MPAAPLVRECGHFWRGNNGRLIKQFQAEYVPALAGQMDVSAFPALLSRPSNFFDMRLAAIAEGDRNTGLEQTPIVFVSLSTSH